MENEKIRINGYEINYYSLNTLVIGSGAASLNAAISLHGFGVEDFAVATSEWGAGTSNNAGSDKQTYYKLSLSGREPDSVYQMAADLFSGKCMHGDIALCEAQGSVQAFMRLVGLGVRFPHDKYGSYAGYKTDHDPRSRATSAGPYTSKSMFEALAGEVRKNNIKVLDHHHCIALLTDQEGTSITGAVALNLREEDPRKAFVIFNSVNVILGTGGPAGIYETSVYPASQSGSTGMAFAAGAPGQNLNESQFGIASIRFRWNLSGSYQQVLPRYVSTDADGQNGKEFLNEFFPDYKTLTRAIFLKGYQWPFDPRKIKDNGSSLIDLLVDREINIKKRRVFLDFTQNPSWKGRAEFLPANLEKDVLSYLEKSDALKSTPLERLKAMNSPAIELYKNNGIDLSEEKLEIAVCNQHNNGGLKGNIWWESDLKHLFPVGEVNGSHGVYRPGGSALNSGQVGSYRAALYISKKYAAAVPGKDVFMKCTKEKIKEILELSGRWLQHKQGDNIQEYFSEIRKRMSSSAGIMRDTETVREAALQAEEMNLTLPEKLAAKTTGDLKDCFLLSDHCLTHYIYLQSLKFYLENGGRSRGSYLVTAKQNSAGSGLLEPELCNFDRDIELKIIESSYRQGKVNFKLQDVREIPEQDLWFEKVWKEYLQDI